MTKHSGFGIIEVIVAMALFIIAAVTGVTTIVGSFSTNRLGNEEATATLFAGQGLEAARSIRNQGWTIPFLDTNCAPGCGVSATSGFWQWLGSNNTSDNFTRTVSVAAVQRDNTGQIVLSGGTDDPDTKKVTSAVAWDFSPTRNNTLELSTYLTNFRRAIVGNWAITSQLASLNLPGNDNTNKLQSSGNYIYVIQSTASPDFLIIDITNPATPTIVGTLALSGTPQNIFVINNFAYIASNDNSEELQIIDVSNPAAPSLVSSYNDAGNEDGLGVFVSGAYAYLSLNAGNNLAIINISNPATPTLSGNLALNGSANEVAVYNNYAYIASTDNSQEMQVIDVTTPTAPTLVSSLNLSGTIDATAITFSDTMALIGQDNFFHIIDLTNPLSPTLLSTFNAVGTIKDIALNLDNSNSYAFIVTTDNNLEFQVISIVDPSTPILFGSVNTAGNDDLNGVCYSTTFDRVVVGGDANSAELIVIRPQ